MATCRVTLGDKSFDLERGQTLLDGALFEGIDFPHSCQIGSCSTCKCLLVSGQVRALSDFDYVLSVEEITRGIILACQSTPKTDLEVAFLPDE